MVQESPARARKSRAIQPAVLPAGVDIYENRKSLAFSLRARRFERIQTLIETILLESGRCNILDLGGTETYWLIGEDFIRRNQHRLSFTLVNIKRQEVRQRDLFESVAGSATDPGLLAGCTFDLVHSNSVVEHVGSWRDMEAFATNTRRLASRYYVQTPNYWFPYEPHFRFPGFQYLPKHVRVAMIMRFSLGFFLRIDDRSEAEAIISRHQLISTRQMARLFPDGELHHEKFAGMNKSIIAIRDPKPVAN
ncbi:hypothetical protein V1291_003328 [Nitrobacteraceae bacterium AZCC 1564]